VEEVGRGEGKRGKENSKSGKGRRENIRGGIVSVFGECQEEK